MSAASADGLVSVANVERGFDIAAAGDAGFLAFEPGNLGLQIERAGFQIGGELERHEQDDFVVVAVGGDFERAAVFPGAAIGFRRR